ncbi:MAG: 16S rRNA (cytosine(1402)-N(4))-methyltransferase RsmH [Candidatus Marinimicrobia bacterium]|nr:16S rRNA (cytosine(1402)-N(4))-methyltransferase RsmH [Candidatus Neomarinimicrobiota bacterium]MBT3634161.1 16S rRNA (cytosine(1402)-N(4))-methyltransferase RsmH [Candidatus Neomarinimicrobiota bacterium]MBT3683198.1 16S rRNA (cytosine(1402)-N(4))-methyltransferase RsmH [Candidatus Neomarinimicrobiota bacterium]MBT3759754.1 16S rRNA (cytosine(1402)-N(4))-methyltransferase RsmH [Candidatus Neomarinimicrobiota bacterium]MBT3895840.1 16S rRNA (cytosine(1402)-N(4))-methyltransferase RsmH [Candi
MPEIHPHVPILVNDVLEHLVTNPNGIYLDGTVGFGGHASHILKKLSPDGLLIGMDCDSDALSYTTERLSKISQNNFKLIHNNFRYYPEILKKLKINKIDGLLLDLGMSSYELDTPDRGFSFNSNGPLDMRFDISKGMAAMDYIHSESEAGLAKVIKSYGEERYAKKIANSIVQCIKAGKMSTTYDLREAVLSVVWGQHRLKSVSRVFQAIRIKINDELESLSISLINAEGMINIHGRLAVISFHSLEDRIVKKFIQRSSLSCICPKEIPICVCNQIPTFNKVNRKAIIPSSGEISHNPRARSAKLRLAERI